jgi:O-antigen/teichoic acid export membrane protein
MSGSLGKPALQLVIGRTLGYAAAVATPLVLPRVLSQDQIGTYKHLFLLYGTLYGLGQVGMAESLYYFLPQSPHNGGRYVANAILTLATAGLVCVAFGWLAAPAIASRMSDPALARYLPLFGLVIALSLMSAVFDIVLVSRQQYRTASGLYAVSELFRAGFIVGPTLALRNVGALVGGVFAFCVVRCTALFAYLFHQFGRALRPDFRLWKAQLRYTVPYTISGLAGFNLGDYLVSFWVDSAGFAIYSYGCLQVPLLDLVGTSYGSVLMVRMGDDLRQGRPVAGLWREITAKLAFIFFPLAAALMLTAHQLFAVVFPASYAASVPIFIVSSSAIVLSAFPFDAVLRVYAELRLRLVLNVLRQVIVVSGMWWFFRAYGLPGAVFVAVSARFVVTAVAVSQIARLMRVGLREMLPWRTLALTVAGSLVAVLPATLVRDQVSLPPLLRGAVTTLVYGVAYLAVMTAVGLLPHPRVWQRRRLESRAEIR